MTTDAAASTTPSAATDGASHAGPSRNITIVGAGLAGSLLAVLLAKRGHKVALYEKRPDPRAAGYVGGRSINLALSTRGLHGLELAGLKQTILDHAVPMRGRMIHQASGDVVFSPYGVDPSQAINSVSRGGLNIELLNAAEAEGVSITFEQALVDLDLDAARCTFEGPDDATNEVAADLVVGADGAFSAVRGVMQKGVDKFNYSQSWLSHGYKELHIPADEAGTHRIDANSLHIWPRGDFMMIALPNEDGSFTVTLFWPFEGPHAFDKLTSEAEVEAFFRQHFPDAVPHLPTLAEDYRENPTSGLVTVRCGPWHHKDKVVLIGDASHAVVPFYGQGINAGFEDCAEFVRLLDANPGDLGAVIAAYSEVRKPNADALADLCIHNFIEMQSKTASPLFRLQQRIEKAISRWFPTKFLPLYSMVTFTRMPYAEAMRRWQKQTRFMQSALYIATVLGLAAIGTLLIFLALPPT